VTPKKVLWIEDGIYSEMRKHASPVRIELGYSLDIAESASEGLAKILTSEYDLVVVDIRLPPGEDHEWKAIQRKHLAGGGPARLGLTLLQKLLGEDPIEKPAWVDASRFAVLTIETYNNIGPAVRDLGIRVCHHKERLSEPTALLRVVKEALGEEES